MAPQMTAMIDVVFLLLTYFLLIGQFRGREETLGVIMPARAETVAGAAVAGDAFSLPERPINVLVRSVGMGASEYVISTDSAVLGTAGPVTTFEELAGAAKDRRGSLLAAEQRWVIRPTAEARWEHALGAMMALRDAGFVNIRFGKETP
jgi:biopolymer transport protein ExbD